MADHLRASFFQSGSTTTGASGSVAAGAGAATAVELFALALARASRIARPGGESNRKVRSPAHSKPGATPLIITPAFTEFRQPSTLRIVWSA